MDKKYCYYFHAGSANHGCEAIVRSTCALLAERPIIFSENPDSDKLFGVAAIADVRRYSPWNSTIWEKLVTKISEKLLHTEAYSYNMVSKYEAKQFPAGSVALSIGGDNYCYGEAYNLHLAGLNRQLHRRGIKTILWGCSIEPSELTPSVKKDLARYDLIVARESISFSALSAINSHTMLACDPAFCLAIEPVELPELFSRCPMVGLNLSPLIQAKEAEPGITIRNYRNLISTILRDTEYGIALIPHVVLPGNDDRSVLRTLYDEFCETGRICMVEDMTCGELKHVISACRFFIGARTHATIAAYSTGVPTLAVGYSTKALGIAKDLFGSTDRYVLPVQQLITEDALSEGFTRIQKNEPEIRATLSRIMPEYCASITAAVKAVKQM